MSKGKNQKTSGEIGYFAIRIFRKSTKSTITVPYHGYSSTISTICDNMLGQFSGWNVEAFSIDGYEFDRLTRVAKGLE